MCVCLCARGVFARAGKSFVRKCRVALLSGLADVQHERKEAMLIQSAVVIVVIVIVVVVVVLSCGCFYFS